MPIRHSKAVRYPVVGLGHIAQNAVLPAFAHARRNSRLTALVSDDPVKQNALAKKYRVSATFGYDQYEDCLQQVDAVYIALPNSMHADFTIGAANAGVHVLCEKPMAVTVDQCQRMILACREADTKLMIAYRLHFEAINLRAVDLVRRGRIGEPKFFNSSFSLTVRPGDIRTRRETGGGTLCDIGVYCIKRGPLLVPAEWKEVVAISVNAGGKLAEIDESTTTFGYTSSAHQIWTEHDHIRIRTITGRINLEQSWAQERLEVSGTLRAGVRMADRQKRDFSCDVNSRSSGPHLI